ncbi:MAG: ABC transporter ATP-binding protein/permease [Chloroflexota bacterium]|nr:ABC transporter ATP-binding protein/permease [Chloroflexota bacterium]
MIRVYSRFLRTYLGPLWRRAALLGVLLVLGVALELLNPQIVRAFIDTAQAGGTVEALAGAAMVYIGIALVGQIVAVADTYLAESVGQAATNALRADLTTHCLNLDMPFHDARTPGEMIERVDGDVAALANFFSRFVLSLGASALMLLGVLVLVYREDWRMGVVFTLLSGAALVLMERIRAMGARYVRASRQSSAELIGFLEERLVGLADVQANGAAGYVVFRAEERLREQFRTVRLAVVVGSLLGSVTSAVFAIGTIAVFALGAYFYRGGSMTLGTVFLMFQYTSMLRNHLGRIQRQARDFQSASASMARVQELLGTRAGLAPAGLERLGDGPLAVELDHVTFAYGVEPVLRDVSLQLAPGRVLGLLGRTGSGKTTIARLLLRLYDPQAGALRIGSPDGRSIDVRDVAPDELHRRIGMVTQEVQLFRATVRENLTLFDSSIPDQRILEALDRLGLSDWLAGLPRTASESFGENQLDAELAPGATGLSAGEAQLLAFARVFLRDPGLVILDEASSRLDPGTQRVLERAVDGLLAERTAILIAHRLATVERADDIAIVEDGRIVEHGPRATLAADPGSRLRALLDGRTLEPTAVMLNRNDEGSVSRSGPLHAVHAGATYAD